MQTSGVIVSLFARTFLQVCPKVKRLQQKYRGSMAAASLQCANAFREVSLVEYDTQERITVSCFCALTSFPQFHIRDQSKVNSRVSCWL
jgi:hypothetical protein